MNHSIWVKIILLKALTCYALNSYSQKAKISIQLKDSIYNKEAKVSLQVKAKNNKYKSYPIHDSLYIKEHLGYPSSNSLIPYLEKKEKDSFFDYLPVSSQEIAIPEIDTCVYICCECIVLKKGESLNMEIPILTGYKLTPGFYRLSISLRPLSPSIKMKARLQHPEIQSNYVYFYFSPAL